MRLLEKKDYTTEDIDQFYQICYEFYLKYTTEICRYSITNYLHILRCEYIHYYMTKYHNLY